MGKNIIQHGLFSKKASSSGGGGGTPTNISYTAVDITQAFISQNVTFDWVEGWYKVTGIPGVDGFYSRTYEDKDGIIQLSVYGEIQFVGSGGSSFYGKGRLNFTGGIIDQVELILDNALFQRVTSSVGVDVISTFGYFLGDTAWNNIDLIDPTITVYDSTNYITSVIGSVGDTFTFTNSEQFVHGLNAGSSRIISFGSAAHMGYTNCTIGSGKTIAIQSSQTERFWVDNISSFQEILDVDIHQYIDGFGVKVCDLALFNHAGRIILSSLGGLNPVPIIQAFINYNTTVGFEVRFTTDANTCNPTVDPAAYINKFSYPIAQLALVGFNDYITLRVDATGTNLLAVDADQY